MAKIKKVYPLVKGTEVTINYKNQFGNNIAVNINSEKGFEYPEEGNENLKVEILKAIRAGSLIIKEVEVEVKKNQKDAFMSALEGFATIASNDKPTETKAQATTIQNKPEVKHEVTKPTETKTEENPSDSDIKDTILNIKNDSKNSQGRRRK